MSPHSSIRMGKEHWLSLIHIYRTGAYVVMETQLGGSAWSIELRCPAACYNLLEVGRVYGPVYYVGKGENGLKYLTNICPKPEGTES